MRRPWCICAYLLFLGVVCSGAQQREGFSADFVGTWTGSWEGAGGTGGFELVLEKGKEGALGGNVSVAGEPTYKATIKSVAFDGNKMTATYDFPPDERLEVRLTATFEVGAANGTWSAREAGSGNEVAAGTWTVKKK
jgi:hypothetical protein